MKPLYVVLSNALHAVKHWFITNTPPRLHACEDCREICCMTERWKNCNKRIADMRGK
jgi:hypothetical protein